MAIVQFIWYFHFTCPATGSVGIIIVIVMLLWTEGTEHRELSYSRQVILWLDGAQVCMSGFVSVQRPSTMYVGI